MPDALAFVAPRFGALMVLETAYLVGPVLRPAASADYRPAGLTMATADDRGPNLPFAPALPTEACHDRLFAGTTRSPKGHARSTGQLGCGHAVRPWASSGIPSE